MYRTMFNFLKRSNNELQLNRFYTVLSQNDKVTYAIAYAYDFCKAINVDISLLNRTIDDTHKNQLLTDFTNNQHFMGSIKLVFETNNNIEKYRVIDGQHRFLALYDYYKNNNEDNIHLLLELYEVDDINGEEANRLFIMANTVKNIDYEKDIRDNNKQDYIDLVKKIGSYFPNTIKDGTRLHYPNISYKDLKEQLQDLQILERYTSEQVIQKILHLNNEYSTKTMAYFFGEDYRESKDYDRYLNAFVKSRNNKCWLGLKRTGKRLNFITEL